VADVKTAPQKGLLLVPLPVPIALDTKDKAAGLKINAERAADEAAIGVETTARRCA